MEKENIEEINNEKYDAIINFIENGVNNILNEQLYKKILNKEMVFIKEDKLEPVDNNLSNRDYDILYINSNNSKSIINVYINECDKENIKDIIRDLFLRCKNKGIYTIGITALELKKSGITYVEMRNAITSTYESSEFDDLNVIIFNYIEKSNKPKRKKNLVFNQFNINHANQTNTLINFDPSVMHLVTNNNAPANNARHKKLQDDRIYQNAMAMANINPNDFKFVDWDKYTRPLDFVYDVVNMDRLSLEKKVYKTVGCKRSRPAQIAKQDTVSNMILFIYGVIFNFTQTEMIELLICNGQSYNVTDPVDDYFYGYFTGVCGPFNYAQLYEDFYEQTGLILTIGGEFTD